MKIYPCYVFGSGWNMKGISGQKTLALEKNKSDFAPFLCNN
jgi:hypothetical protein